jgi:hypothetical protein
LIISNLRTTEKFQPQIIAKLTCAATVCDLVGNNLEMHAVLNPASERPKAACCEKD